MTTLAPFALHRATTVAEATDLLMEHGDDAVIYAGGTELLLLMKLRFANPAHLVDIKPITELGGIDVVEGHLRIGAGVAHREIERSPIVRSGWPGIAAMERWVANLRVRNVGTLGGNLAFADPHSDPAAYLLASDAQVVLGRGESRRRLPISEFLVGAYTTALEPGELLVSVDVPALETGTGSSHQRFAFHERPAVTVSCLTQVVDGTLRAARIAIGSVGAATLRVPEAEALLAGLDARDPDPDLLARAGAIAARVSDPVEDANGSIDYKRHLVTILTGRGLRAALERAQAA